MFKNIRKPCEEQGFTLVELLVVIMIIGLLAAIAIPIFMNQQKTAKDASLKSDLKNASAVITEANLSPTEFYALFGKNGINEFGENSEHSLGSPVTWNSKVPTVSQMALSTGTVLAIFMYHSASLEWEPMEIGEFCLSATNHRSNFNYRPGSGGGAQNYDRYLYYDVSYGGVATMDELVRAYESGSKISCTGHVKQYKNANA